MIRTVMLFSAGLLSVAGAPAIAQTAADTGSVAPPAAQPTPLPTPTRAPVIILPTLRPTADIAPRSISDSSARRPTSVRRAPGRPLPIPVPEPTAATRAAPSVAITPVPLTPSDSGLIGPLPNPSPLPSPAPIPDETAPPDPLAWVLPAVLLVLVVVGGAAWLFARRRRAAALARSQPFTPIADPDAGGGGGALWVPAVPAKLPPSQPVEGIETAAATEPAAPAFLDPAPRLAPPLAQPRAWIEIDVQPRRAGLNLLTATADLAIVVRNAGDAPAAQVRLDVRMINAGEARDAALAALYDAAMAKPVVPAFALAAGDSREVRAVATLPREAILPMKMGEHDIFVPVITIDVRYLRDADADADADTGQTAAAFMLGIVRDGADKLAPFRIGGPTRMHDQIGARPHGPHRAE